MSGVAYTVPSARWGARLQNQVFVDAMIHALHCGSHIIPHPEDGPVDPKKPPLCFFKGKPYMMGHTAEFVAQHMDISREEMDAVALRSNRQAEEATRKGPFKQEIVQSLKEIEPNFADWMVAVNYEVEKKTMTPVAEKKKTG